MREPAGAAKTRLAATVESVRRSIRQFRGRDRSEQQGQVGARPPGELRGDHDRGEHRSREDTEAPSRPNPSR
jgi:hypothetical protein